VRMFGAARRGNATEVVVTAQLRQRMVRSARALGGRR
jgi:hypothetical protein